MPYLTILIIGRFVVFFYRAAEFEDESALIWCGLSVADFRADMFCGWAGACWEFRSARLGLFAGITIFRILRKP